ncbi:MAG: hypothetical protein VKJ04_09975 [Vampirovibrionales bacterium]|nr:hypothetical protein [Vampirovibrionales bacterium]
MTLKPKAWSLFKCVFLAGVLADVGLLIALITLIFFSDINVLGFENNEQASKLLNWISSFMLALRLGWAYALWSSRKTSKSWVLKSIVIGYLIIFHLLPILEGIFRLKLLSLITVTILLISFIKIINYTIQNRTELKEEVIRASQSIKEGRLISK